MTEAPPFCISPPVDFRGADCQRLRLIDHRDPDRTNPALTENPQTESTPVVVPQAAGPHLERLLQTQDDWQLYQRREPQPV